MLHLVRKHADSWMIKAILWTIVLAFIATIFVSWGMGGNVGGRSGTLATVNGSEIFLNDYDRAYSNLLNFYRDQFGQQFSQDLVEKLGLKNQALDQLIFSHLVQKVADEQNIKVSDQELADRIKTFPAFQRDNKFNRELYDNYLNFNRTTPRDFEGDLRESLVREKVEAFIKKNVKVSWSEVREVFRKENEKAKFSYITFPKDHYAMEGEPSEDDIKKYLEKNPKPFEIPEQVKAEYLRMVPKMVEDQLEIADEDISDYYEAQKAEFHIKKQYTAKHILFNIDNNSPPAEDEKDKTSDAEKEAMELAKETLKKIKEGAKFEDLAKELSFDKVSGSNGGDLGQFSKGTMVPAFEAALEKLKPGEISEPVKSRFGIHLIRLDKVEEERFRPLEKVKDEIRKKLLTKKGRIRIHRIIKNVHQAASGNNDLAAAAKQVGQETRTTDFISRKDHVIPDIGVVPEFFNQVFQLPDDTVSQPINTPEASFLIKIVERKPPSAPKLEEVRDKVLEALKKDRKEKATREKFKALEKKLASSKNLEELSKELDLDIQETPHFSMADSIPRIGNIQSIKDKVFAKQPGETTSGESKSAYYLIKVLERTEAGEPEQGKMQSAYDRLKIQRGNQVYQEWLKNLKEKADIKVKEELLNSVT